MDKQDKTDLINIIKKIDVKKMDIDHKNPIIVKWFRFGNFNALRVVTEIIKALPEKDSVS